MGATDRIVTLVNLVKFEGPDGDVRLCDGGFVDHASEEYQSLHAVFGTVASWPNVSAAMDGLAEDAQLVLAPAPGATLADWWRTDLLDCRVRVWQGELDTDQLTVINATLLGDWLVDNAGRAQSADGDLLQLDLIARTERLFLTDEGNVCSDRFHQSVYPGELGFVNCTDVQGYFAWGALDTSREETSKSGKKKDKKKGKG